MAETRYFLRGEIDLADRDRIRCELAVALKRPSDLLVDCRDLTFLDSSGIAVLVDVRNQLAATGHEMLLVNVSGPPLRVLEVVGLTNLLSIDRASPRSEHEHREWQRQRAPRDRRAVEGGMGRPGRTKGGRGWTSGTRWSTTC